MGSDLGGLGEELLAQCDQRRPAHQEAPRKQDAADAQRAQALNLPIATREALRGRLERPADGREGEHVADKVGQTVYRVGQESCSELAGFLIQLSLGLTLAVEHVSAKALAHGHAQVDIEADSGDADAGIALVGRQQERVVVVVVVVMARMAARLRLGRHGGRGIVSYATYRRGPVEREGGGPGILCPLCG